jgi:hypothetical protein
VERVVTFEVASVTQPPAPAAVTEPSLVCSIIHSWDETAPVPSPSNYALVASPYTNLNLSTQVFALDVAVPVTECDVAVRSEFPAVMIAIISAYVKTADDVPA